MIKRIVGIWLIATFGFVGILSLAAGRWYLGLSNNTVVEVVLQLGLIMVPYILLSILALRFGWPIPIGSLRDALGWRWSGWRAVLVSLIGLVMVFFFTNLVISFFGPGIPYNLPGVEPLNSSNLLGAIGLLLFLAVYVGLTVVGEETFYRGLAQTQLARDGFLISLLLPVGLFILRHLPDALFYAHLWHATPQMWLTQELQLTVGALLLGLVRYYGRSTYASAIMHACIFVFMVV